MNIIVCRIIDKMKSLFYSLIYLTPARNIDIEQIYPVFRSKSFNRDVKYGLYFTVKN